MFGSNFDTNFGLPQFPFQGMDPQGGLLGTNVPTGNPTAPGSDSMLPGGPTALQGASGAPAAGLPGAPSQPALGAPSPLGGGVLSPGAGAPQPSLGAAPTDQTAPAAGVGSPFGKVGV